MARRISGCLMFVFALETLSARMKRYNLKESGGDTSLLLDTPCGDAASTPTGAEGTCGSRVEWMVNNMGATEVDAGKSVANQFPNECTACAPQSYGPCGAAVSTPTGTDGTCGSRIEWMVSNLGITDVEAGVQVAVEFPIECASCGAAVTTTTSTTTTVATIDLATTTVATAALVSQGPCGAAAGTPTGNEGTCGSRIEWMVNNLGITDAEAGVNVAAEFPSECRSCGPVVVGPCGDSADVDAGGYTCAARVTYQQSQGMTAIDAGNAVAIEFSACSACGESITIRPPSTGSYCGIAVSIYSCKVEADALKVVDNDVGDAVGHMCMGYGGTHPPAWEGLTAADRDMCTLNIHNDCFEWYEASAGNYQCRNSYGANKNPDDCQGKYLFLWDEPMTNGKSAAWAAEQWKLHVDTWSPQIAALRARGTKITSPLFTDLGGAAIDKFGQFFARCVELGIGCSDPNSNYYIDSLLTNQWLHGAKADHASQEEWIRSEMATISAKYDNRPVVLGNFGWIGATTADQQADVISTSRLFERSWSGLEAVFYFAARDYGGGTANNGLGAMTSSGQTLRAVLANRCKPYVTNSR